MLRTTVFSLCIGLAALGCDSAEGTSAHRSAEAQPRSQADDCDAPVGDAERNDEVRLALEEHCASCHQVGAIGYFASLDAFQNLLVADSRLVVPGDPEASELIKLLEGSGSGSLPQMPLGMNSFADLDDQGLTAISMDELRTWIAELEVNGTAASTPDYDARTVRKLSARHFEHGLRDLLGLERDDFFRDASSYGVLVEEHRGRGLYPVHDPDAIPGSFSPSPVDNFFNLGGGSTLRAVGADPNFTPPLVQTLVPLSQQWCSMAVAKENNEALFRHATPDTTSDDADAVRANIRHLYLRFLAVEATEADIDEVFDQVFVPLESDGDNDAATAWAGVCSYFVRHPQFLVY